MGRPTLIATIAGGLLLACTAAAGPPPTTEPTASGAVRAVAGSRPRTAQDRPLARMARPAANPDPSVIGPDRSRTGPDPSPTSPGRPLAAPNRPWRWPLDGVPRILRPFDPPPQPWLAGHRGVDLGAPPGTPVYSTADGVLVHVGDLAGRGVLSVAHAGGLRTSYEPVQAGAGLRAGQPVRAGQQLGTLAGGHRGCPAGCLHWGLRHGGRYLDPLLLLGHGRARLLPL